MAGEDGGGRFRLVVDGPHYAQLWESVLFDRDVRHAAKVLYAVLHRLAWHLGPGSEIPSYTQLGRMAGMNRETVGICLRELAAHGHIQRRRRPGFTDELALTAPQKFDADAFLTDILGPKNGLTTREESRGGAGISGSEINTVGLPENPAGVAGNSGNRERNFRQPTGDTFKDKREKREIPPLPPLEGGNSPAPEAQGRGRPAYTQEFLAFWTAYPHTNGTKVEAFKVWRRLNLDDRAAAVAGLGKWVASDLWRSGKICYPQKYLNTRMWDEEPAEETRRNGRGREHINATIVQSRPAPALKPLPTPQEQAAEDARRVAAETERRRESQARVSAVHAWLRDEAARLGLSVLMMRFEAGLEAGWEHPVRLGLPRSWRKEWDPYLVAAREQQQTAGQEMHA